MPHTVEEVCTYGDGTYGDGHYGICNRGNLRGCGPAGPGSDPITETKVLDPDCHEEREC